MNKFLLDFSFARKATDEQLNNFLPLPQDLTQSVVEAMRYSTIGSGKAFRPYLIYTVGEMLNVSQNVLGPLAGAVEMVHSYSLIHDDLPAMDNDDMRRGKPANHIRFGEATAILAGDGLLTKAFEVLASLPLDAIEKCLLIEKLAYFIGTKGMIGGQIIDLKGEKQELSFSEILQMQDLKTGALIQFSCLAPAIAAKSTKQEQTALSQYAQALGLIFQITDDLLDLKGDSSKVGKTLGKDKKSHKSTLFHLLGESETINLLQQYETKAHLALEPFGAKADKLHQLIKLIINREN